MLRRRRGRGDSRGEAGAGPRGGAAPLASPVFLALFDLPWVPLFLGCIAMFHPWLGLAALAGGRLLVAIALVNQRSLGPRPRRGRRGAGTRPAAIAAELRGEAGMVQALGLTARGRGALAGRPVARRCAARLRAAEIGGVWTGLSRVLRHAAAVGDAGAGAPFW